MGEAAEIEGVVKYRLEHEAGPLCARRYGPMVEPLLGWRRICFDLGLIGQDPARYGGAGFGNASVRVNPIGAGHGRRRHLITGTQTGKIAALGLRHMALVHSYSAPHNHVVSEGEIAPSSETLTHGAIYDASPAIRCVIHVHHASLWKFAQSRRLPSTSSQTAYGTPYMATEMRQLAAGRAASIGVVVMPGHEDGLLTFGASPAQAGGRLLTLLAECHSQ